MIKPAKPPRRNNQSTLLDECIAQALESMLEQDADITHRAVVRAVDGLSAPSSITRDSYRRCLVEHYQAVQAERRGWVNRIKKASQETTIAQLAAKNRRIEELERKVAILTASHKAMILAVGEMGGVAAWRRFFESYALMPELMELSSTSVEK
ncbi:hypothetical protein [Stutzerimonas zhaodongensis]|jgi:hypothetical protein|uniref:hypothetical protein n=1 Tax=Stutzerimonas zhaodongensis TaxID=1176257 RepID=UPI001F4E8793|nr:hypothetical protein [Stutzerimonas zhaodongensis]UNG20815.1 hypothetical protein MKP10_11640 [Stutzerimonas zhaodongensis]